MRFDLSGEIKDINGNSLKEPKTIKEIIVDAVLSTEENEKGATKYEKYKLATRINESETGEVDLSAEDVVLIKDMIGKNYVPLVVGQIYNILA